MPISTSNTHLYYSKTGTWTEVAPIKTVPAMFGEPETLETTTLSDSAQTYIQGIKKVDGNLQFGMNYDGAVVDSIIAMKGTSYTWLLVVGGTVTAGTTPALSTDNKGAFTWAGTCDVGISEAKVNAVYESTLYVSPSTPITKTATLPTAS